MAVFVAGADESTSRDGTGEFYFGGFIAPERVWSEDFAPAWQERVLDRRPRLDYLHVAELRSPHWRKQHGIREIDAERKIDEAFRLIRKHRSLYPITAHLNADHFKSAMARGKIKMRIKTPGGIARKSFDADCFCFLRFALHALHYVREAHADAEKVDFIIERKGPITKHIRRFHESIAMTLRARGRPDLAELVGELIPGGKDRVPLQAADLLCWYTRNAANLRTVDRRRYADIQERGGIKSRASEQWVDDMVERARRAGITDGDSDDDALIVGP